MRRVLSLVLAFVLCLSMCFSLSACGNRKEIKLTLQNYKEYLNIERCRVVEHDESVSVGYLGNIARCTELVCVVRTSGASSNFNFNNVKIKVRCHGTYGTNKLVSASGDADSGSVQSFDEIVEVTLNIAGEISTSEGLVSAPTGKAIVEVNAQCEIVSISGSITPA